MDHFSWRWIFLINPLLAFPTIWIAYRHLPESRDPEAKPGLDWRGATLVLLGLGALIYGLIAAPISGWRRARGADGGPDSSHCVRVGRVWEQRSDATA